MAGIRMGEVHDLLTAVVPRDQPSRAIPRGILSPRPCAVRSRHLRRFDRVVRGVAGGIERPGLLLPKLTLSDATSAAGERRIRRGRSLPLSSGGGGKEETISDTINPKN